MHIHHSALNRGDEPEKNSGQKGQGKSESQDFPIQTDFARAWNRVRTDVKDEPESPVSNQESESAADQGEQHTFSQQLARNSPAAGAHRRPNRHFFLARAGPSEQKVRDVRAGDE